MRLLEAYGVDTVFGIPGVHTVELYRGLPATRIRHVTPRHEQGAGFMADGYARVSGRPGVCFIITGPGMTNILTAMGQAYRRFGADAGDLERQPHRASGHGSGPAARAALAARPGRGDRRVQPHRSFCASQLPEVLARAFALFASARPRPVHIEIPIDVITAPADDLSLAPRPLPGRPAPDPDAIERAAALLRGARAPLMVLGGGAAHAASEAVALAERFDTPVINTVNAKGILPPDHPLHAGENMAWPPLREALRAADVVLAVGTEFGETEMYPDPQPLRFDGRLVRVDIDPEQLVRGFPADLPILADSRLTLAALLAAGDVPARRDSGAARAAALREAVRSLWWSSVAVHQRLLGAVQAALPNAVIAGDQTQPVYAGNQFYAPEQPRSWFNSSTGYGTLGYALPAAIGAKLAAPDRPVVALIGDGGLQFTLPELASAVEARVPVTVLVWNNQGYGEIKAYMAEKGIPEIGVDIYTPDLVAIARGYGCAGERATSLEHLRELLLAGRGRECRA